ncbi:MAG: folate family ECF transporter S component [Oscillibacter sp.]|nr:folate family ECF transporter S component [Oscillibacter sp.]
MSIYTSPFSSSFWRDARAEVGSMKKLTFAALMIALCVMLGYIPAVPLFGGARLTWGFLARSVCAWVCGPVLGAAFGVAEDLLSFFLTGGGGGPFFPGYTLTTVLGVVIYALFFYRQEITIRRIFFAKLLTNVQNVLLGALWSSILYGKAYLVIAGGSAVKNLIMLPFQTILLVAIFTAVTPVLGRMGLVPKQKGKLKW